MKKLISLFLPAILLFAACETEPEEPIIEDPVAEEPEEPELTDTLTNCSLAEVKLELEREPIEGLLPDQITQCYSYGTTDYAFVTQPNTWNAMQTVRDWEAEGNSAWSGLLKRDAGKDWEVFYEIQDEDFNPVGFYVQAEQLVLDAADDSGAGSGEGTLYRYVYAFAGVTDENLNKWTRERCDGYYIPESYTEDTVCN